MKCWSSPNGQNSSNGDSKALWHAPLNYTIIWHIRIYVDICAMLAEAKRTLGFLRRTLFSCSRVLKETAYKGLMRHILEYGSSIWDPHSVSPKEELEKVKKACS